MAQRARAALTVVAGRLIQPLLQRSDPRAGEITERLLRDQQILPPLLELLSAGLSQALWQRRKDTKYSAATDPVFPSRAGTPLHDANVFKRVLKPAAHRAGVLWQDASRPNTQWQRPDVGSGLPLREAERLFQPVHALATAPEGTPLLAGGPSGVFRRPDTSERYEPCSTREFTEKVTLPPTWLLCSGSHELEVVTDDEER